MADYTQNITNSVNVFGEGPSTKWGQTSFPYTMTWGTSKWGEGGRVEFQIIKVISNSQDTAWDETAISVNKVFEIGSQSIANEMSSETMKQGIWNHVFVSNESEAESRDFATWTVVASPDATFTAGSANGTSWSES